MKARIKVVKNGREFGQTDNLSVSEVTQETCCNKYIANIVLFYVLKRPKDVKTVSRIEIACVKKIRRIEAFAKSTMQNYSLRCSLDDKGSFQTERNFNLIAFYSLWHTTRSGG